MVGNGSVCVLWTLTMRSWIRGLCRTVSAFYWERSSERSCFLPSPLYFRPRNSLFIFYLFIFFPASSPTCLFKNTALGEKKKKKSTLVLFFPLHHILILSLHCTQCRGWKNPNDDQLTRAAVWWLLTIHGFFQFLTGIPKGSEKADVGYCSHDFVIDFNLLSSRLLF